MSWMDLITKSVNKSIVDIDVLLDNTTKSNGYVIYQFENSDVNITNSVARYYKQKGYDVFASFDPESNVYGGGDRILIKF